MPRSDRPLKRCVFINPETLPDDYNPAAEIEYVDIGNVNQTRGIVSVEKMNFGDAPSRARRLVRSGDTIISTVRTYLKAVAPIENPPENMVVSTGFAVLRPGAGVHPKFLAWLAQSEGFVQRVEAHSVGVSYPAISPSVLGSLSVHLPPLGDQRAVADFLDRETGPIDELIAKKERLITLLRQEFTTALARGVRHGIDASADSMDSGLVWWGPVPRHWRSTKLRNLFTMMGGLTPDKANAEYWDGAIPWVSPKDMKQEKVTDSIDHISAAALAESGLHMIAPPAVLIVVRGMILAHTFPVGVTSVAVTVNQDMKALLPNDSCSAPFLAELLRGLSDVILTLVEDSAHGTKCLRTDRWRSLDLFVPERAEQDRLVAWSDQKRRRLTALCGAESLLIDKLREYRTALISAAVTGHLDVRTYRKEPESILEAT